MMAQRTAGRAPSAPRLAPTGAAYSAADRNLYQSGYSAGLSGEAPQRAMSSPLAWASGYADGARELRARRTVGR